MELLDEYQLHFVVFYDPSIWYLQQQSLTIKFWGQVIKSNNKDCNTWESMELYEITTQKEVTYF